MLLEIIIAIVLGILAGIFNNARAKGYTTMAQYLRDLAKQGSDI